LPPLAKAEPRSPARAEQPPRQIVSAAPPAVVAPQATVTAEAIASAEHLASAPPVTLPIARPDVVAALPPAPDTAVIPPPAPLLPQVMRGKRAPGPKPVARRLAALPPFSVVPGKPAASDVPAITVLRGGPLRYAQSVRTEPVSATPVIRVMRPSRFVPPGPLILRVTD
jgi:hypothetical protein